MNNQKLLIMRACFFFMLFFYVSIVLSEDGAEQPASGEPAYITDKLMELESLRLTSPQQFDNGLLELAPEQGKMSSYQQCYYSFLTSYQMAFKGASQAAVTAMEKLVPVCEDLRVKIRLHALMANVSAIGGDYVKASNHIDMVIQNAEQTADKSAKLVAYSVAAIVYNLLDQRELGMKYSELLYNYEPNEKNLCHFNYSSNAHHLDNEQHNIDLSQVKSMAEQCMNSGNSLYSLFIVLDNVKWKLTNKTPEMSQLIEIENTLNLVQDDVKNSQYQNILGIYAAIQAKLNWFKGDTEQARNYAEEALALNEKLGITEQLIMALEVLENISSQQGDYVKSYEYLNQKNEAELKLYDQSQAKQMAFMTVKHSNLAKVFEIEQLNQQKEVLELEKQLARQEANNQRLIILLILIILSFVILLLLRIKKKHDYFRAVSEIDHLTKVLTRKAFEEQMSVILDESREQKKTVQLAIMDLDHFKLVNDNHGHLVGDWVLKNVVYAVKELIEENMIIARLGGEEFCVVMTDTNQADMHAKLEHMRQSIEQLDCSDSAADLAVTASFGYTSSDISGYALPLLLTHADVALFEAKKQGRNQIVLAHIEH